MQPTPSGTGNFSGGGGSGGGGSGVASGELNRIGLARFRSAPATWLEALLEGEEEEEEETLKPNQSLTQLLSSNTPASRNSVAFGSSSAVQHGNLFEPLGFQRQNSSPADFLGNSVIESDAYFPNFGIPASYDYLSPSIDVSPSSKRTRDAELLDASPKFPSLLKGEPTTHGLMDMEMDKLMEDSVPCRVRAKRGCATHPRSIAERVRRTRISDRIRKLQELVPNMDKQTNTADMLDEAVEYVKFLQKQIQELTEHQRRCTCVVKE